MVKRNINHTSCNRLVEKRSDETSEITTGYPAGIYLPKDRDKALKLLILLGIAPEQEGFTIKRIQDAINREENALWYLESK
jgi:hypothetical protein